MSSFLSDIGSGIEQADPGLASLARSQDLGSALKNAAGYVGGQVAKLPGEAVDFSDVGQAASAVSALQPHLTSTQRALALAGVGLGVLGGATAWSAAHGTLRDAFTPNEDGMFRLPGGPSRDLEALKSETPEPTELANSFRVGSMMRAADDPYALSGAMSTYSGTAAGFTQHKTALAGFVNGLGTRLGQIPTWAQATADDSPGTAIPKRAAFVLSQFQALIDQKLAGKTLEPYVSTYKDLTRDAPGLLSTAAGRQRAQDLQDFLHRMSDASVDWVPHPMWQVSPLWKLSHVNESPDQTVNFSFTQPSMPTDAELHGTDYITRGGKSMTTGSIAREKGLRQLNPVALIPQYVQNIQHTLDLANDEDWKAGVGQTKAELYADPSRRGGWYPEANDTLGKLATEVNLPLASTAAATSLLSAGQEWTKNIDKAASIIRGIQWGEVTPQDLRSQGFMVSRADYDKVRAIVTGTSTPEDLFIHGKSAAGAASAQKQLNFWLNLTHPELWLPTTVDRHAHDIANGFDSGVNKRPLDKNAFYTSMAQSYRQVAMANGLTPAETQAITWVAWKRLKDDWNFEGNPNHSPATQVGGWERPKGPLVLDPTIKNMIVGQDPTLWSTIRQMPKDDLAPGVPGGVEPDTGVGLQIHHSVGGVRIEGPVNDRMRSQVRVLYPAGDPGSDDATRAPLAPVAPRPVADLADHLRAQFFAGGDGPQHDPVGGEITADPAAANHPLTIPGSHLVVRASLEDEGALNAYYAHLRDRLGLDMHTVAKINGPVRYEATARGTSGLGPQDIARMSPQELEGESSPLNSHHWVGLTGWRAGASKSTNEAAMRSLQSELEQRGYKPIQADGMYGGHEPSFIVFDMPNSEAIDLGRQYRQESVVSPDGLMYTTGEHAGQMNPAQGAATAWDLSHPQEHLPDDYYTDLKVGGKTVRFQQPIDFDTTHPIPADIDRSSYNAPAKPMRSLMVHLGDAPDRQLVQSAWDAVKQVSTETGKKLEPVFYGGADGPDGASPVGEHLFASKAGLMSTRSQDMDVQSANSAHAWVPTAEAEKLPAGPNRLHAAVTQPTYEETKGPKGEVTGAVADGSIRVQFTHLKPVGTSQRYSLADDITKSRLFGKQPKFLSVLFPATPEQMPAVSLGIQGKDQADAGLRSLRPAPGRTVHVEVKGGSVRIVDTPNELMARQTVGILRRLGVPPSTSIKLPDLNAPAVAAPEEPPLPAGWHSMDEEF